MIETLVFVATVSASEALLRDETDPYQLNFVHQTGAAGDWHFPEITGAGAGLLDLNQDGLLDVYLVQSGPWQPADKRGGVAGRR